MTSMNEKYNMVLQGLSDIKGNCTYASVFNLEYDEYKGIVDALEYDGLINKGEWCLSGGYHPMGLTFDGRNFIENNDSKEYYKIEKTEIHNNNNLNIENNHGIAVAGNNNTINNSEFNQKFTQLIQEIENSSIGNKAQILQKLNEKKEDSESLKPYLYSLLSVASDTAAVISVIGGLLGIIG